MEIYDMGKVILGIIKKQRIPFLLILLPLIFGQSGTLPADTVSATDTGKNNIIQITSNSSIFNGAEKFAEFIGNVIAKKENEIITSDKLQVYLASINETSNTKLEQDTIKQIIATGNVTIRQTDKTAYAEKAVFDTLTQRSNLTGVDCRVTMGSNSLQAEEITFYSNKDLMEAKGSPRKRVHTILDSPRSEKNSPVLSTPKSTTNDVIHIISDSAAIDGIRKKAIFLGNVHAEKGDNLIKSDQLIVDFIANEKSAPDKNISQEAIKTISAMGNVDIKLEDKTAQAEKATYEPQNQKIILTGNCRLSIKRNVFTGSEVIFYLDKELTEAHGTPDKPVQSLIYPEDENIHND